MTLYNCQHAGDEYRITKFDAFGNVESSYLCTESECDCPAGVRPTCRHRQMLPQFIRHGAVNTGWQLDYDRGGWTDFRTEEELLPPLPEGVQAFSLEDPVALHNAIADAVGEPEIKFQLGGFPDWCLSTCTTQDNCILNGCIKGHGITPRPAPARTFRRF